MASERMKRCTNSACKANGPIRRAFPAELTKCPYCGSSLRFVDPPRAARKGSGKGGGKTGGYKLVGYGSRTPKPRKKKQPKKPLLLKNTMRKDVGRKR